MEPPGNLLGCASSQRMIDRQPAKGSYGLPGLVVALQNLLGFEVGDYSGHG